MYRADGPEELRPVGETEFVNGIAAMSASGRYGATRVAAGIVGFADLTLGERVGAVLDAHLAASPRFRGIRHAAGWDASDRRPQLPHESAAAASSRRARLPPRLRRARPARAHASTPGSTTRSSPSSTTSRARFPTRTIVLDHFGGPLGIGPYAGRRDEVFHGLEGRDPRASPAARTSSPSSAGSGMPLNGFGFHTRERAGHLGRARRAHARLVSARDRAFGPARCMFESNFPVDKASCSYRVLWNSFKRIAAGLGPRRRPRSSTTRPRASIGSTARGRGA